MDRTLHQFTAIRRLRVCLLLPVLLILSQQGAWLHALSHAAYAASSHQVTVRQAPDSLESGVCPSCQSFGQLGSALATSLAVLPTPAIPLCPQTELKYSSPAPRLTAPRNRGPPLLA